MNTYITKVLKIPGFLLVFIIFLSCEEKPAGTDNTQVTLEGSLNKIDSVYVNDESSYAADTIPLKNVPISLANKSRQTDTTGAFKFTGLQKEQYTLEIEGGEYKAEDTTINLQNNTTVHWHLSGEKEKKPHALNGRVIDSRLLAYMPYAYDVVEDYRWQNVGMEELKVQLNDTITQTDSEGYFGFEQLKEGSYQLSVYQENYTYFDTTLTIQENDSLDITVDARKSSYFPLSVNNTWNYNFSSNSYHHDGSSKSIEGTMKWIAEEKTLHNEALHFAVKNFVSATVQESFPEESGKPDTTYSISDTTSFKIIQSDSNRIYFKSMNYLHLPEANDEIPIQKNYAVDRDDELRLQALGTKTDSHITVGKDSGIVNYSFSIGGNSGYGSSLRLKSGSLKK